MYVSMHKIEGEGIIVPKTISVDHAVWNAFVEKYGKGQISELVRAVMKEEVLKKKNEEAQRCDPLSLNMIEPVKQERQMTLFENFDVLSKYIHGIDNVEKLARIEKQGKVMRDIAHTRKMKVLKGLPHIQH